jgi:uncharacterized protein YjbI with pentapeptide repeats
MVNGSHLEILDQGIKIWNKWREENREIRPDLSRLKLYDSDLMKIDFIGSILNEVLFKGVDLSESNLNEANLTNAIFDDVWGYKSNFSRTKVLNANFNYVNLERSELTHSNFENSRLNRVNLDNSNIKNSNLNKIELKKSKLKSSDLRKCTFKSAFIKKTDISKANLKMANLEGSKLIEVNFENADLRGANLNNTIIEGVNFEKANLSRASFIGAKINNTNLMNTHLVETNFEKTNIENCYIYGISAWDLNLKGSNQSNLIITREGESIITVDNIEVAQFIYMLIHSNKIRHVIDTITSKVVLILGRFTPTRKIILDSIKNELRKYDYLPVLFDFNKPLSRDFTETVTLLAKMSKFIIVDITDPKSVPHELQAIIPTNKIPVQPLLYSSESEYGMFNDFKIYPWVLNTYNYNNIEDLLQNFKEKVISPAEAKIKELKK